MVRTSHEESARRVDSNCKCHLMIDEVSLESNAKGTSVKCKMTVLGSTDPSQIGKAVTEFFKCEGKGAGMFLNVAQAAGLITAAQRKQAQDAGVGMDVDENLLKGKQIAATISMEPNMIKDVVAGGYKVNPEDPGPYARIGFETYGIWDQKAGEIPLDQQMAALVPRPAGQPARQPAASPAQQPAQQPQQQNLPLSGPANPPSMNW